MFLNPFMLFAMAGVAAPILIHLLSRRRIERVTWAAMRFLQNAVKQNQRRINIEDLLLLLLRCMIVALIALAMSRPALRSPISSIFGQSKVSAAIVLDNSESMALSDGTTTRFDVSRKIATDVIASLPPGSSVAIYLASDTSTGLIAEPTADLFLARQTIEQAQRTDRGTNLLPAITQAVQALAANSSLRKELYVVTDGQTAAFKQIADIRTLLNQNKQQIHTTFLLDGIPETHNLAVTGFKLGDAQYPVQNQSLVFDVAVTNYGTEPAQGVDIKLNVDKEPPDQDVTIDSIPPGESRSVSVLAKFRESGYHSMTAQMVPHDRMPRDDQRTIAVRVIKQLQVLLVGSEKGTDTRESASYFLRQALTPVPPEQRDSYFVRTKTVTPAQLDATRLADYDLVILANVSTVPAAAGESLAQYVAAGGGLIVFPGPLTDPNFYNNQLLAKNNLLPAKLGNLRGNPADLSKFLTLQAGDYTHPIVTLWSDPKAGTLTSAHFYRSFNLTPEASTQKSAVTTILKFNDGSPAVVSRRVGDGEVILFGSSANTAWNDMPVRPAYLPLLFRAVGQLVQHRDASLNLRVGDPFTFQAQAEYADKDAAIIRPESGEASAAAPAAAPVKDLRRVELVAGQPTLLYEDTNLGGVYEVTIPGDKPLLLKFAAQPDIAESNLTLSSDSQLDRLSQVAQVIHYGAETKLADSLEKDRVGKELWLMLALLALGVAVTEMLLADWFSQSK